MSLDWRTRQYAEQSERAAEASRLRPGAPGANPNVWLPQARSLTQTERKYMLDAARGLTAPQIARRHTVSTNTVNWTLKQAKQALGAYNIANAAVLCLYYGEFDLEDLVEGASDDA